MKTASDVIVEALNGLVPRVALVLGSGLGGLVEAVDDAVRVPYSKLPGFPESGVSGHAGEVVAGTIGGKPVLLLSGRVHYYEKGDAAAMRPVLEVLKGLGIEKLILTNAAGSLRDDLAPGSVMLIEDHINFSGTNPLIGEEDDARFTGMTSAYDSGLRETIAKAAKAEGIALDTGVYMWFSGPSFETPAEIRMARTLGADLVGMSTAPEIILGRFFGLRCAAASTVVNFAAGMTGAEISHEETMALAPVGAQKLERIIRRYLRDRAWNGKR
jgi:purine-nucleoside phosphorylase